MLFFADVADPAVLASDGFHDSAAHPRFLDRCPKHAGDEAKRLLFLVVLLARPLLKGDMNNASAGRSLTFMERKYYMYSEVYTKVGAQGG